MFVYRISLTKWSKSLISSGKVARWNSEGNNMIYTAASRALACLESVVHRSRKGVIGEFKVMIIEIPPELKIEKISFDELPESWFTYEHLEECNEIGDRWLQKKSSAILRVPSAIIINEFNFLINPEHPDFKKIKLDRIEDFGFFANCKLPTAN